MDRYIVIFLSVLVIPMALMFIIIMTYCVQLNDKFTDEDLDTIVNYSTDAAVDEILTNTTDLDMDYTDFERTNVDPKTALRKFCTIFLDSYGMSLSEENYEMVKTKYISTFLVAAYDGYYIATRQVINSSGANDLVFSLKQPYIYQDGYSIYGLNLGKKDAKLYVGGEISKVAAPISKEKQSMIINSTISDALMYTMFTQSDMETMSTIYVPSKLTTLSKSNPIEGVTVIAYISDEVSDLSNKAESFGVGGTRISHQDFVGCYRYNGKWVYAYTRNIPSTTPIVQMYDSPLEAAKHGYYFDMRFLGK